MTELNHINSNAYRNGIYGEEGAGMEYIDMLRVKIKREINEVKPPNLIVGQFGIKDDKGNDITINWKIDGWRRKKNWSPEQPELASKYGKSLFESMFKGWD